jgi:hypothetical protein
VKKLLASFFTFSIFASFFTGVAFAKPDTVNIPDVDGIYDDPGHPGLKVRVFVHRERPGSPPVDNTLVCSTDPNSNAVDGKTGWKLPTNWSYNLNPTSVPASVGSDNLTTFADRAFSVWETPSGINFTKGSDTTATRQAYDGQNIVAWGRTSGSALAVTYTRYYTSTGQVVDVDTIMNKKFAWSWTDQSAYPLCALTNTYDAQNILTHELGHWMGLDDHYTSDYVNNTMYGYGSKGEFKKDTLTTGDINGVEAVYP